MPHTGDYGGKKPVKQMKKEAKAMHKKRPKFMMAEGGKVKVKSHGK